MNSWQSEDSRPGTPTGYSQNPLWCATGLLRGFAAIGLAALVAACRVVPGAPPDPQDLQTPQSIREATPATDVPIAAGTPASKVALSFVDHASFRKLSSDQGRLDADLATVERNLDAAAAEGASSYVLFTGDLEKVLTYDFVVPGIGEVGRRAFPTDSPWRADAGRYRAALVKAIAAGRRRGIDVLVQTNQFSYPEAVFDVVAPSIADAQGQICPDRPATWALYRAKLGELFDVLPGLAGIQLTADEAEQSLFGCASGSAAGGARGSGGATEPAGSGGAGGDLAAADGSTLARVNRLVTETAGVAAEHGLRVEARTWGRLYTLEREADPAQMFEGLPVNTRLSLKYTQGDFHLFSPPSPLLAHVDQRAILELDAWGEHLGFNFFPCYLGPIWSPVIRAASDRGLAQLSVRVSWDNDANPLFDRPWGNVVNVDLARAMSERADVDPDLFLKGWVDQGYGPAARDAAFRLYQRSTALQSVWLAEGDVELTDHSRLFRPYRGSDGDLFERVRDRLDRLQAAGGFTNARDFAARRTRVDAACVEADGLVEALAATGGAPKGWTAELARGARAQCRVARGTVDQLELLFLRRERARGGPAPDLAATTDRSLGALEADIRKWTADWQTEDAASFEWLEGAAGMALVDGTS